MARKKPNNEGQLSFDDIDRPYHDYSQETEGDYPMVVANDDPGVRQPVNEIDEEEDAAFTPDDLADSYWDNLYEKFGIKPADREAIEAAKELFQASRQSKTSTEQDALLPTNNQLEETSPERIERMNALLALDIYLRYIAYTNKLKGLRRQFHADPSKIKNEYGHEAKDVLHGAQVMRDFMHSEYQDALKILFDARKTTPELVNFSTAESLESFVKMLEEAYGSSGNEFVKKRNELRDDVASKLGGHAAVAVMALDRPASSR